MCIGRHRYCDMCTGRRLYCDMCRARRTRHSDMCTRQTPLLRHVTPAESATATCTRSTDPATATCEPSAGTAPATCDPRRTTYCDMYPARRPRLSGMFLPQNHLLRHVTCQPIRLQRHVPPADTATATCAGPPNPPERHVPPADAPTATCGEPAESATATCSSRGKLRSISRVGDGASGR